MSSKKRPFGPDFRGSSPPEKKLKNGDDKVGITSHASPALTKQDSPKRIPSSSRQSSISSTRQPDGSSHREYSEHSHSYTPAPAAPARMRAAEQTPPAGLDVMALVRATTACVDRDRAREELKRAQEESQQSQLDQFPSLNQQQARREAKVRRTLEERQQEVDKAMASVSHTVSLAPAAVSSVGHERTRKEWDGLRAENAKLRELVADLDRRQRDAADRLQKTETELSDQRKDWHAIDSSCRRQSNQQRSVADDVDHQSREISRVLGDIEKLNRDQQADSISLVALRRETDKISEIQKLAKSANARTNDTQEQFGKFRRESNALLVSHSGEFVRPLQAQVDALEAVSSKAGMAKRIDESPTVRNLARDMQVLQVLVQGLRGQVDNGVSNLGSDALSHIEEALVRRQSFWQSTEGRIAELVNAAVGRRFHEWQEDATRAFDERIRTLQVDYEKRLAAVETRPNAPDLAQAKTLSAAQHAMHGRVLELENQHHDLSAGLQATEDACGQFMNDFKAHILDELRARDGRMRAVEKRMGDRQAAPAGSDDQSPGDLPFEMSRLRESSTASEQSMPLAQDRYAQVGVTLSHVKTTVEDHATNIQSHRDTLVEQEKEIMTVRKYAQGVEKSLSDKVGKMEMAVVSLENRYSNISTEDMYRKIVSYIGQTTPSEMDKMRTAMQLQQQECGQIKNHCRDMMGRIKDHGGRFANLEAQLNRQGTQVQALAEHKRQPGPTHEPGEMVHQLEQILGTVQPLQEEQTRHGDSIHRLFNAVGRCESQFKRLNNCLDNPVL